MEEYRWEKCPFFGEGQCPHSKVIDRAYLIPQLLNATKFEAAVRLCTNCGHYLSERRKYVRLRKPFRSYIYKEDGETTIIGNIVNVSGVGTLVRLEDWPQFDIQEKVRLEIYSTHAPLEAVKDKFIRATGEVKRIDGRKRKLAVMFLPEVDQQSLHSL